MSPFDHPGFGIPQDARAALLQSAGRPIHPIPLTYKDSIGIGWTFQAQIIEGIKIYDKEEELSALEPGAMST